MAKFICAYSGKEYDDSERSVEHIIPDSSGGADSFSITSVAKTINSEVGTKIDASFLKNWCVAAQIFLLGVKSKNGTSPKLNWGESEIDVAGNNHRLTAILREDGWDFLLKDMKTETLSADGKKKNISYLVKPQEVDGFLKKVQERFAKNGQAPEITIGSPVKTGEDLKSKITFNLNDVAREYIKIALATAVRKFGEGFSSTTDADLLREGLWADDSKLTSLKIRGQVWPNYQEEATARFLSNPHKHIVALIQAGDRIGCFISLFSTFPGMIQITHDIKKYGPIIDRGCVFEIDPISKKMKEYPFIDYLLTKDPIEVEIYIQQMQAKFGDKMPPRPTLPNSLISDPAFKKNRK